MTIEEEVKTDFTDLLNPEAKLCIMLKNLCKKRGISREDFVDYAVDNLEDDYKSVESARQMIKRHLEKFEESGLISVSYDGAKKGNVIRLKKLNSVGSIGLIKMDKVFSGRFVAIALIVSLAMFIGSLLFAMLTSDIVYIFVTMFYFILMIIVYFSYRESFIFK